MNNANIDVRITKERLVEDFELEGMEETVFFRNPENITFTDKKLMFNWEDFEANLGLKKNGAQGSMNYSAPEIMKRVKKELKE